MINNSWIVQKIIDYLIDGYLYIVGMSGRPLMLTRKKKLLHFIGIRSSIFTGKRG